MSTLQATNLKNASSASNNIVLDTAGNATVAGTMAMGSSYLRNRIINGDMRFDQRNVGTSVTPANGQYALDRWGASQTSAGKFSIQQQTAVVPVGFSHALKITSLSSYAVGAGDIFGIYQPVEGFNSADFSFGTANAQTVTLSFWVYSSLTGTFGGSIFNAALTRTYPFSYSISSANTWTKITITMPGDTTGTWVGATNGVGMYVVLSVGVGSTYSGTANAWSAGWYYSVTGATSIVGTNGATWYVTGVQLEVGSVATPFERRQYGQELALCQRYYEKSYFPDLKPGTANINGAAHIYVLGTSSVVCGMTAFFANVKRAIPTVTVYSSITGNSGVMYSYSTSADRAAVIESGASSFFFYDNAANVVGGVNSTAQWTASAEL